MQKIQFLLSNAFYRISSVLSGTFYLKKIKIIKKYELKEREEIEDFQFQALKKLINTAYIEVPFYRKKYKERGLDDTSLVSLADLSKFPFVSKSEIKEEYRSMINNKYSLNNLKRTTSSGSTGAPKSFYYDKKTYGWRMASLFNGWSRVGFKLGQKWMRITNGERNSLFYRLWNYFSRCTYVNADKLDNESLDNIIELIKKDKPSLIYSYSISMYLIADYLDKKGEKIDFVNIIITHGSILFPHYREVIERVFGIKVTDTYGGDGMVMSGQCSNGNYHIQDLGIILEFVDDNYNPLPAGVKGRVLVTDLHNHAMPIIRYEIGDLGIREKGICGCGNNFSLMRQPEGRDTDIIKLSNGTILTVHYFGVLFRKYENKILAFQVREIEENFLKILLVVSNQFTELLKRSLVDEITTYADGGVKLEIELVDEIPVLNINKRRYMIGRDDIVGVA